MALSVPTAMLHRLLDHWHVGTLATVTEDARPHLVPIVFCREGEVVYSPLDGKRKRSQHLKRFRNLEAHQGVSLLLDHYDQDWDQLWWVRIDGRARRLDADTALAGRLAERLRAKYPQYERVPLQFAGDVYLEIRVGTVSAWSQSGTLTPIAAISTARVPPRAGS